MWNGYFFVSQVNSMTSPGKEEINQRLYPTIIAFTKADIVLFKGVKL
jgi:hypothetical protein